MSKYKFVFEEQINWLKSLIFSNGEFVLNNHSSNNSYKIVPYFSNIAALALLLDTNNCGIVKSYLKWYLAHINTTDKLGAKGTIYDYYLKTDGSLISTQDYDSNDSYPSTFFTLCLKYFKVSSDYKFFIINKSKFDIILNSLISTFDKDFLTWAKPNYKIKYLMDNCEVFRGLEDAFELYKNVFNDNESSRVIKYYGQKIFHSIQTLLWNKNYYYYQIDQNGKSASPNFNKFYPDASSQLFPILNEVILSSSNQSQKIYQNFCINFPDIKAIEQQDDFPNCYISYVSLLMKDYARCEKFLNYYINKYIKNDNKWPWYSVESSYFIRTISGLENS